MVQVMELRTNNTALIVIDMTNGWCSPDGHMTKLGFDTNMCRETVGKCSSLIKSARQSKVPVIFTRHIYREDYSDSGFIVDEIMPQLKLVKPASANAWSNQIVSQLEPQPEDIIVKKNRYSAFLSRIFANHLRSLSISDLVLCGVTTSMCVESTARDAAQRDYRTFVVKDATADIEVIRHERALINLEFGFAHLISVADATAKWGNY